MEEKIYGLIEKIYGEMQKSFKELRSEMQNGFTELEKRQDQLENDIKTLGNQVAHIENELNPKIVVALDGYKVLNEKLEIIENKVDKLAVTVESHDVKIEVIRGLK